MLPEFGRGARRRGQTGTGPERGERGPGGVGQPPRPRCRSATCRPAALLRCWARARSGAAGSGARCASQQATYPTFRTPSVRTPTDATRPLFSPSNTKFTASISRRSQQSDYILIQMDRHAFKYMLVQNNRLNQFI